MQQHESDPQESLPQKTLRQEKDLAEDLNPSEATASYSSQNLTFSRFVRPPAGWRSESERK